MSTIQPAPNLLRERIKLALAPLLALVLAGVIWHNYRPASTPLPKPPPRRAPNGQPAATATSTSPVRARPQWPKLALADVLAHDPFSLPAPPPPPSSTLAVESISPATESPEETETPSEGVVPFSGRVEAIYRVGNQSFAIVESRTVRLGDLLNGQRVVEIRPDGILLEDNAE